MRTLLAIMFAAMTIAAADTRPAGPHKRVIPPFSTTRPIRFAYVDVIIDSHDRPMAAYQFELKATRGDVKFVGISGGDNKGFQDPPYYDPVAMSHAGPARIVVGAFGLADDLPKGKTRVARLSLAIEGDAKPEYTVRVIVAGAKDGSEIPAEATLVEGAAQ